MKAKSRLTSNKLRDWSITNEHLPYGTLLLMAPLQFAQLAARRERLQFRLQFQAARCPFAPYRSWRAELVERGASIVFRERRLVSHLQRHPLRATITGVGLILLVLNRLI